VRQKLRSQAQKLDFSLASLSPLSLPAKACGEIFANCGKAFACNKFGLNLSKSRKSILYYQISAQAIHEVFIIRMKKIWPKLLLLLKKA
jgi:hypothetical protein